MVALLVVMVPAAALGTPQQQFQNYQSPTLGVSIQYPSDWKLLEESNDKLRFVKQEGFVTADVNVEEIDQSDATLPEYANTRVNELRTQRPDFQLLSFEPTMISNDIPAQKVVYTFDREEDGKTNKVMRIWSINEGKIYTLAYIAESSQYDRYLPAFQKMVDSFDIDAGGSSTAQEGDNERSSPPPPGGCDRISYPDPDVCIPPYPPDLNCPDIPYKNFEVTGTDPHGFDRDNDGLGCESANGGVKPPPIPPPGGNCDRISYPDPDVCIPSYPPDLNCPDIPYKNFKVAGTDPHGFDRDNDGIGCESANGGVKPPPIPPPGGNCDASYPTVCIKSPPPDLNCGDISYRNFKVTGSDPHGFDRDNDGIGCDSASVGDEPDQCTEDGLSAGSYFDPRNGFIVGSPCDPVEYCSDKGSKDPVVIDYCQDIWTDTDECLLNPKLCEDVPPPECPEGQVGTPPDCEVPPPECPEGQVGTPPDCEPVINGNGEDPPENGEDPPENGEDPREDPPEDENENGNGDEGDEGSFG